MTSSHDVHEPTTQRAKLIVTIDTEEDNWGHDRLPHYRCENIDRIPIVQELFGSFGVLPTYLLTYPVATDPGAVSVLKPILGAAQCEIGAHCHPWNTPPLTEANTAANSMLCNLATDTQFRKLKCLSETIQTSFGIEPRLFRSGRFGYDTSVAQNLAKLGYRIDTSITPYIKWERGRDFTDIAPRPFRFSSEDACRESASGGLIEVPVSIGFLQRDFARRNHMLKTLTSDPLRRFRLAGICARLRVLNRTWLSPELADGHSMIRLARTMMRDGYRFLNLMFHSPSLVAGLTPFVRTRDDERRFVRNLREFLAFARDFGIEPVRLSEVERLV